MERGDNDHPKERPVGERLGRGTRRLTAVVGIAVAAAAIVAVVVLESDPGSVADVTSTTTSHEPSPASTTQVPATTSAPTTTRVPTVPVDVEASFAADDVFVPDCGPQPFGSDIVPVAEPLDRLGPLYLLSLDSVQYADEETLTPSAEGELAIWKFPTQLEGEETVWLAVGADDRAHATLIYDSSRWVGNQDGRLPFEAGDPVVRFDVCSNPSGYTQYIGGMLVSGVRCVTLEVYVAGDSEGPVAFEIPFGQDACA